MASAIRKCFYCNHTGLVQEIWLVYFFIYIILDIILTFFFILCFYNFYKNQHLPHLTKRYPKLILGTSLTFLWYAYDCSHWVFIRQRGGWHKLPRDHLTVADISFVGSSKVALTLQNDIFSKRSQNPTKNRCQNSEHDFIIFTPLKPFFVFLLRAWILNFDIRWNLAMLKYKWKCLISCKYGCEKQSYNFYS